MRDSPLYTLGFTGAVCLVCALVVSSTSVLLREVQADNRQRDRQQQVLRIAGLAADGERLSRREVRRRFAADVRVQSIELLSGRGSEDNAEASTMQAPPNGAGLVRIPHHIEVYSTSSVLVLPVEGKGLWSTMRGFLALDAADGRTIVGLSFYEHAETPGLGGEIDNPRWRARWKGRLAFDAEGEVAIRVVKGAVGSPAQMPHQVDAISGATLTCRGVSELVRFWLGPSGYGPYLAQRRRAKAGAP